GFASLRGRFAALRAARNLSAQCAPPQELQLHLLVRGRRGPRERVALREARCGDPRAHLRGELLELALLYRERLGEPRALLFELGRAPPRALGRAAHREELAHGEAREVVLAARDRELHVGVERCDLAVEVERLLAEPARLLHARVHLRALAVE